MIIEDFVTRVLNEIKLQSRDTREAILGGLDDFASYNRSVGVLYGLSMAIDILIKEAEKGDTNA